MSDNKDVNETPDEFQPDILLLEDEEGNQHAFEVLDETDIDGAVYFALVPTDEDPAKALEQDAEMIIMRVDNEDEQDVLNVVQDMDELKKVADVFVKRLEDAYDIDLEDF